MYFFCKNIGRASRNKRSKIKVTSSTFFPKGREIDKVYMSNDNFFHVRALHILVIQAPNKVTHLLMWFCSLNVQGLYQFGHWSSGDALSLKCNGAGAQRSIQVDHSFWSSYLLFRKQTYKNKGDRGIFLMCANKFKTRFFNFFYPLCLMLS